MTTNHKITKVCLQFVFLLILVLSLILPSYAENNFIDLSHLGSISINLNDNQNETPISDVDFSLFKIADINSESLPLHYQLLDDFVNSNIDISNLNDYSVPKKFEKYIQENYIASNAICTTNIDGKANINSLSVGLYVLSQTNISNEYFHCSPTLISIPTNIDNTLVFNVDISPKIEKLNGESELVSLTVNKVWINNGGTNPKSINVTITKNGEDYNTVTLNSENNWSYTWTKLDSLYKWNVIETNVPDGYTPSYSSDENTIIITNRKNTDTLIQTGQFNWIIPVLSIVGIILFTFGWWIVFRKKYENK